MQPSTFLDAFSLAAQVQRSDLTAGAVTCHNASVVCNYATQFESVVFDQTTVPVTETQCSVLTVCVAGTYQAVAPTATSDRSCLSCTAGSNFTSSSGQVTSFSF